MTVPTLLRTLPTAARVPHRAVLSLGGPQAAEFLNGIIASTVHNPPKGHFFSAFLHAQAGTLAPNVALYSKVHN
jgi:folate-binding Fe-S cluster repair protein YgfZ